MTSRRKVAPTPKVTWLELGLILAIFALIFGTIALTIAV